MTVAELRQLAKNRNIKVPSRIRKAELISLLSGKPPATTAKKQTVKKQGKITAVKSGRGIKVNSKTYFSNLPAGYSIDSEDDLLVIGGEGVTALVRDASGTVYVAKENLGSRSFATELSFAEHAIAAGISAKIVARNKTTIVMEKLGQTLCEYKISQERKLNKGEMDKIYDLIRTAYAAGIKHNDFKCNNIMLHPTSEQWMLIDFGMSKQFNAKDPINVEIGALTSLLNLSRNMIRPGWSEFREYTMNKLAEIAPKYGMTANDLGLRVPLIKQVILKKQRVAAAIAKLRDKGKKR